MRDYSIVTPSFWIGETGKLLRGQPDAQLLALYLMTSPHSTMTGVFHCPIIYMAHETGLTFEGATKALARLYEVGFCEYDTASECVFVVRMASYQMADTLSPNDNRHKGLLKDLAKMASAQLRSRFVATYSIAFSLPKTPFDASPLQAPPKPRTGTRTRTGAGTGETDKSVSARPTKKCPADFSVTEDMRETMAVECPLVDLDAQTAVFRDHEFKTARSDWPAVWRNWMRTKQERLTESAPHCAAQVVETFKERDARIGRERWEQMTGEAHPENKVRSILDVVDITPINRIGVAA